MQLSRTCRFLQDLGRCINIDDLTRGVAHGAYDLCLNTYFLKPICRVAFLKQVCRGCLGSDQFNSMQLGG